jgi:transposase
MPSDALPDDLETLKAMLLADQCESERLRQIIKEMQSSVKYSEVVD